MMLLFQIHRRYSVRYHEVKILTPNARSSQLFILNPLQSQLITKLLVLILESLKFLTLIESSATSPVSFRKSNGNKEACDKQAGGKSQEKWNESLKESGVTHILHLLKTSSINYGDQENSVSPRLNFYLNSFGGCGKVFCKQN